ncbi:hypothetical protein R0I08_003886 [Salmonella enterica]|nr:hypothetical protein [Salmonella enterica]
MSNELLKVVEFPVKLSGNSDMEGIIIHINNYIRSQENPSSVGAAKELKRVLSENGMSPDDEEIFYNFDDQYKVKYVEDGRQQVAVFWSPWLGGVSWRIEDDK